MAEKKKPGTLAAVAVWAVLAAVLYGCFFTGEPRIKSADELRAEKIEMAYIRCENETEARVVDPDGFRIADRPNWKVDWGEGQSTVVFQYEVVARNAFGGLVPGQFRCAASHDGTRWSVTDLTQQ